MDRFIRVDLAQLFSSLGHDDLLACEKLIKERKTQLQFKASEMTEEEKDLVKQHNTVKAIKMYRDRTKENLIEARNVVYTFIAQREKLLRRP